MTLPATCPVGSLARVRVPATSANLGPGFDSFGLALSTYDHVAAEVVEAGLQVEVSGPAAADLPRDESNLVVRAMRAVMARLGLRQPALRLSAHNAMPVGRGLGSSAAAVVAGIRLAEELCGASLGEEGRLSLAAELEGHADNAAACLLGGLTICWRSGQDTRAVRLAVHPEVIPLLLLAPQPLPTQRARAMLPDSVQHGDAAANSAAAGLLVTALTSRPDLLLPATEDRIHQRYRRAAMPATLDLVAELRGRGVAAVVSGAGPSVLALCTAATVPVALGVVPPGWAGLELQVGSGAEVGESA